MAKFHINKNGVAAPCKATKGNCPYGGTTGNENHYDSLEEEHIKQSINDLIDYIRDNYDMEDM